MSVVEKATNERLPRRIWHRKMACVVRHWFCDREVTAKVTMIDRTRQILSQDPDPWNAGGAAPTVVFRSESSGVINFPFSLILAFFLVTVLALPWMAQLYSAQLSEELPAACPYLRHLCKDEDAPDGYHSARQLAPYAFSSVLKESRGSSLLVSRR